MERVLVLSLVLFSSLSGGELLDNEISEQMKVGPEVVNVPEQPCPADLHTVLREMSVKLAELQCKMETLQSISHELQTKTNEVDPIKEQLRGHTAELNNIKTWTNVTGNHVDSLRRDRAVGRVAFSASLLASGSGHVGPFSDHTTLVFKNVFSNIGNAYNSHTGFFTAPVRGVYRFDFSSLATSGSPTTATFLMKNEEHIVMAEQYQTNRWGTGVNGATLLLEADDVVFLRLWQGCKIYDNHNHLSTFSGHLLFPM